MAIFINCANSAANLISFDIAFLAAIKNEAAL